MSERLSDELRTFTALTYETPGHPMNGWIGRERTQAILNRAADKLDEYDRLLNGGPCPTCGGTGSLPGANPNSGWAYCENLDCVDGRIPGVIERLEAHYTRAADGNLYLNYIADPWPLSETVLAVLAALRQHGGQE